MRFQKQQKTICNFRKKKKKTRKKMIEKEKKEHNGEGNLCVEPTKYQRIAFLEHKNFIFRKIICNFAAV